jgi:hypothetical protein
LLQVWEKLGEVLLQAVILTDQQGHGAGEMHRLFESPSDPAQGLFQRFQVTIGAQPVPFAHALQRRQRIHRQLVAVVFKLLIKLGGELGQGLPGKQLPLAAQEVVIEHVHENAAVAPVVRAEPHDAAMHHGMRVGVGIDAQVLPDAALVFLRQSRQIRQTDEIRQYIADLEGRARLREKEMGQPVHGEKSRRRGTGVRPTPSHE